MVEGMMKMADKDDLLEDIMEEMARIHKIKAAAPGCYYHGRVIMLQAAEQLESNVGRALKTMRKARESFEGEGDINQRFNNIKEKRAVIKPYIYKEEEVRLDQRLSDLLKEGDFESCTPVLKRLEELLDEEIAENIEVGIILEAENQEISSGKGSTLSMMFHNHGPFQIRLASLTGLSAQAIVNVLDLYKGDMAPGADKKVQIYIIPKVEGDIALELEANLEIGWRYINVRKGFSVRVVPPAPPQIMQMVQVITQSTGPMLPAPPSAPNPAPSSTGDMDPNVLIVSGSVDQWASCIMAYARGRSAIDLSGMVQANPDYVKSDGYANLFKALMVMGYDPSIEWDEWFRELGFTGEDYTRRCTKLVYIMSSSAERSVELEMDGSVGSSNN
ncbi:MAG TPA: hypothetical protein VLH13_05690, partial [Methanomassiliicoccales archaeon]|nr:hypothetical protein [Methanomassiliicoccales archaeon]